MTTFITIFFWVILIPTVKYTFEDGYLSIKQSLFSRTKKILIKDIRLLDIVSCPDNQVIKRDIKFSFIDYLKVQYLDNEKLNTVYIISKDSLLLKKQIEVMRSDSTIRGFLKVKNSFYLFLYSFFYIAISILLALLFDNIWTHNFILLSLLYGFMITFIFKYFFVYLYRKFNQEYYNNLEVYAIRS